MSDCILCKQRKGKRNCPVLSEPICSSCCGSKRGREITCPTTCHFYRPAPSDRGDETAHQTAIDKLYQFAMTHKAWGDAAKNAFLDGKDTIDEWEFGILMGYITYGHVDENGNRMIDIFMREEGKKLNPNELQAMECLRNARFSLYEVQEIKPDEGLELKDLIFGESLFVREKLGTRHTHKYDAILCWIMKLEDQFQLTGAAANVPRDHIDAVRKAFKKEHRLAKINGLDRFDRRVTARVILASHLTLRAKVQNLVFPQLANMDGEKLIICRSIFDYKNRKAIQEILSQQENFDGDADTDFTWIDPMGRKKLGPGPLHLGHIRFEGKKLILEVNSRERLERGKRLLMEILGSLIQHRLDDFRDVHKTLEDFTSKEPLDKSARDEIPPDIQAELGAQFIKDYMRQWLDDPIPALGNKTPREACRTKSGREKTRELLKSQENILLHQYEGRMVYDFSEIYRELGLSE